MEYDSIGMGHLVTLDSTRSKRDGAQLRQPYHVCLYRAQNRLRSRGP
jgi:hypothetical protein